MVSKEISTAPKAQHKVKDNGRDSSEPDCPSPSQFRTQRSRRPSLHPKKRWTKADVKELVERYDKGEKRTTISTVRLYPPYCNEQVSIDFILALQGIGESRLFAVSQGCIPCAIQWIAIDGASAG